MECGKLKFDTNKRILFVRDDELSLTKKETAIIEYLIFNQNKIVSVEKLLSHALDS